MGEGLGVRESDEVSVSNLSNSIHLPSTARRFRFPLRLERGETDATLAHRMGEGLGVRALVSNPIHRPATARRIRFPLRLERGEGQGEVSSSIHIQEIGIHLQSIAADGREMTADIRANGIDI